MSFRNVRKSFGAILEKIEFKKTIKPPIFFFIANRIKLSKLVFNKSHLSPTFYHLLTCILHSIKLKPTLPLQKTFLNKLMYDCSYILPGIDIILTEFNHCVGCDKTTALFII